MCAHFRARLWRYSGELKQALIMKGKDIHQKIQQVKGEMATVKNASKLKYVTLSKNI